MYIPKGFHWLGPVATVLTGFLIRQQIGGTWDVSVFVQLPLVVIASEWGAYIWQAGVAWQNYQTSTHAPHPHEAGVILDWNTGKPVDVPRVVPLNNDGQMQTIALNQVVDMPKFDNERKVARTLIDQRNHNMDVDLTEAFWIKRGNFGESRDKFVAMKDKWTRLGVIYKVGERKNAKHDVKDWRLVRLIAQGQKLPS
jgi:hypothetical protein